MKRYGDSSRGAGSKIHENLYIELDCLLDTRYGVLVEAIGDKVEYVLANGYHSRLRDEFRYGPNPEDIITRKQFEELYKKRNVSHLKKTILTGMVKLLIDFVQKAKQAMGAGDIDSSSIVLNTYPYDLTPEEKNAFKEALRGCVNPAFNYKLCHLSPAELTPALCRSEYSYMIMYDAGEWLEAQTPRWPALQMPDVVVTTPMLFRGTDMTDEELIQEGKSSHIPYADKPVDPLYVHFRALQLLAQQLVGLEYIPVNQFCVLTE